MPFVRPTLKDIVDRTLADITASLGTQASILRRSWTSIFARAFSGAVHLLYGYIQWAKDQFFVDTAEDDSMIQKAAIYGITRIPASYASGQIIVTGLPSTLVPAGTYFKRQDGQRYVSTLDTSLNLGPTNITVRADEAGELANYSAGSALAMESPIGGVDNTATVSIDNPIELGNDLETLPSLKERYLLRVQNPPQGGSKADYVSWAKEVPGIGLTKVYTPGEISTSPFNPPVGTVEVYFLDAGSNATPSSGRIAQVQAYLDLKKPVTATVRVYGISRQAINFSIRAKPSIGYTFSQMAQDIIAEITDLLNLEGKPGETIHLSNINEAISRPVSEGYHFLDNPSSDVTLAYNQLGVIGTVDITPLA